MPSLVLPATTGRFRHVNPTTGESFVFEPNGKHLLVGAQHEQMRPNPVGGRSAPPNAARLFVGLSVGREARWTIDDVVRETSAFLEETGHAPDASYLLQKGVYKSVIDDSITIEDSVQVILFGFDWPTQEAFIEAMIALADRLIVKLDQEKIYVEMQQKGIPIETIEVVSQEVLDRASPA